MSLGASFGGSGNAILWLAMASLRLSVECAGEGGGDAGGLTRLRQTSSECAINDRRNYHIAKY